MENKEISSFKSPIYGGIKPVDCWDCCGQKTNPNSMSTKAFNALLQSIYNNGFLYPVIVSEEAFIESKMSKLDLLKAQLYSQDDNISASGSHKYSSQLSDEELRKNYKYHVIDGHQRSSLIKLGTYYFLKLSEEKQSEYSKRFKDSNINKDDNYELLLFVSWRENFKIPCLILKGRSHELNTSTTVLMNVAKGSHDFHIVKDIVRDLANTGHTKEWISKNLFMDEESIDRILSMSGITGQFNENDFNDWSPETSYSYIQKERYYMIREAKDYLDKIGMNYNKNSDVIMLAKLNGWRFNGIRTSDLDLAPNGTRRHGRIINGFIPKV